MYGQAFAVVRYTVVSLNFESAPIKFVASLWFSKSILVSLIEVPIICFKASLERLLQIDSLSLLARLVSWQTLTTVMGIQLQETTWSTFVSSESHCFAHRLRYIPVGTYNYAVYSWDHSHANLTSRLPRHSTSRILLTPWHSTVLPLSIQTLCELHRHVTSPNDIIFSIRRLHSNHLNRAHAVASSIIMMLFCIPP